MLHELYIILESILAQITMIAPYWASGLALGSLVSVYLTDRIAAKMTNLGKHRILTICAASVLGVISPLCMYGTIPVIAAFGRKGVPQHLLTAFMVSSVLLNPNLFILGFVLGTGLALSRLFLALLCGILAGVLVLRFLRNKTLFNYDKFAPRNKGKKTFIPDLLKAFRITAPYLLLGVTLTALFTRYVPPEAVAGVFGARRGLGVLFAASLSIPLYVCGGGVIPLLRAWLFAGMGYGDALAFMLAGPATKITNLAAVKMILGAKHFILYLAYVLGFAMLIGLTVELWMM